MSLMSIIPTPDLITLHKKPIRSHGQNLAGGQPPKTRLLSSRSPRPNRVTCRNNVHWRAYLEQGRLGQI